MTDRLLRQQCGYTVTEMVVVLMLLIAIIAMVVPTIVPLQRRGRRAAAVQMVASTVRLARNLAISSQAIYSVRVVNTAEPYIAVYYIKNSPPTYPNSPLAPNWHDDLDGVVGNNDPSGARRATIFEVPGSRARLTPPMRFCPHPKDVAHLLYQAEDDVLTPGDDGPTGDDPAPAETTRLPRFDAAIGFSDGTAGELFFFPDGSASGTCLIPIRHAGQELSVVEVIAVTGEIHMLGVNP